MATRGIRCGFCGKRKGLVWGREAEVLDRNNLARHKAREHGAELKARKAAKRTRIQAQREATQAAVQAAIKDIVKPIVYRMTSYAAKGQPKSRGWIRVMDTGFIGTATKAMRSPDKTGWDRYQYLQKRIALLEDEKLQALEIAWTYGTPARQEDFDAVQAAKESVR